MSNALTISSTVTCSHQFPVTAPSTAKLSVSGSPVLLQNQTAQWVFACTNNPPCKSVSALATGSASKLSVGGVAVLLDSLNGTTNAGSVSAVAGQAKLSAA